MRINLGLFTLALLTFFVTACQNTPPRTVSVDVGVHNWNYEVPEIWVEERQDQEITVWNDNGQRKLAVQLHDGPVQQDLQALVVESMRALRAEPLDPAVWPMYEERARKIVKKAPPSLIDKAKSAQSLLAQPWSEDSEEREKLYRALRDLRVENLPDTMPALEQRVETLLMKPDSRPALDEVTLNHVSGYQFQEKDAEGESWSLFLPFGDRILEFQLWGSAEEFDALKESMEIPVVEETKSPSR
jgi:hypothetical protein